MKIATVLGARPQFIKAAPVSAALKEAGLQEILIHTGQHYDANMSDIFFQELGLDAPKHCLQVGSGSRIHQVAEGLKRIEPILADEKPDIVLVYGDTHATFLGAFAAAALNIPIAHVEAGLRSFNRAMPEETNRILTDHLAQWCFVPTQAAAENLTREGLADKTVLVGDVMLDALLRYQQRALDTRMDLLAQWGVRPGEYYLLTMHRAETTAHPEKVQALLKALDGQGIPVLFPVHPRTRPLVEAYGPYKTIRCVEPLGYLEMLMAESQAARIITDSGGVQKEAAMLGVPCITLRDETEWEETLSMGLNTLAGLSVERLMAALNHRSPSSTTVEAIQGLYGSGQASHNIAERLAEYQPSQR